MARCCGQTQMTQIEDGEHITVSGSGTPQDPFVIAGDIGLGVVDNTQFNLNLTGLGTVASPWNLSLTYAGTAKLNGIPDVSTTPPTNGQVLAWNSGTSKWTPAAPTTAASGSVNHDTSLTGDGSVGVPLQVNEDAAGGLVTGAGGLGLSNASKLAMVRPFADAAARTAATPAPTINSLSVLGTKPGVIDYWTGSAWAPIKAEIDLDATGQLLALSGNYAGGAVRQIVWQMVTTTDTDGVFPILDAFDLAGAAGVISIQLQSTNTPAFTSTVIPAIDHVDGIAYALDGTPLANQNLTYTLTAILY